MMNPGDLSLRDLEYVLAVAETGAFGKAASRCHVSQPAMSQQVRRLEEALGVTLFERTSRRVRVTEAGIPFIEQARQVVVEADKLLRQSRERPEPLSTALRIGAIATLAPYYFPWCLPPLRKTYPKLALLLREGLTHELISELRENRLDAAFTARTFDEAGFRTYSLFTEPFVLAVPAGHPMDRRQPATASALRASEMVLLEDGHCLRDQALDLCPANRRGQARSFHATGVETLKCLVASGVGYTLVPGLSVPARGSGEGGPLEDLVHYRFFPESERVGREILLVTREKDPRQSEFRMLVSTLRKHLPKGVRS